MPDARPSDDSGPTAVMALLNDAESLSFRPPGGSSHDERCGGDCGPCGGCGGIEAMRCLTCGGSGRCQGCGFGEGFDAGVRYVRGELLKAARDG